MAPSADELGLNIGDEGILHVKGAKELNELYDLGAKGGSKLLVVDPEKSGCLAIPGQMIGQLKETKASFVFSSGQDLFSEKIKTKP